MASRHCWTTSPSHLKRVCSSPGCCQDTVLATNRGPTEQVRVWKIPLLAVGIDHRLVGLHGEEPSFLVVQQLETRWTNEDGVATLLDYFPVTPKKGVQQSRLLSGEHLHLQFH
jgi:hypothetical protein